MKPVFVGGVPKINDYAQQATERLFAQTNNTGNLAFRYAIYKHLGRNAAVASWGTPAEKVNALGDLAVFPCSNQLGPSSNCRGRADLTSQLKIPVLAIGLGAQSSSKDEFPEIPEDTLRWVRAISERRAPGTTNLTLRGEFTRRVLERAGIVDGVEVLGCPSLFISDDPFLGRRIAERMSRGMPARVGVAAGNPYKTHVFDLERSLFALASRTGGAYVVQQPLPFIKAARGEFDQVNLAWQKRLLALVEGTPLRQDSQVLPRNITVFFDVEAWMEDLRRHDLVIGTRIHGTMLAIQAGVPAICITHDSRTEEMCQTMGIPNLPAHSLVDQPVSLASLWDRLEFDPDAFDQNRARLAKRYVAVLEGAGVTVSRALKNLAGKRQPLIDSSASTPADDD